MSNSNQNLEERRKKLSDAKRLLLEKRLKSRTRHDGEAEANQSVVHAIDPRPTDSRAAATFAQERLWFLQQLHPSSAAYNMHGVVRLRGPLDVPSLEQCLNLLIARHEILRTSFLVESGQLIQQISPTLSLTLTQTDLSAEPEASRLEHALALCVEEARQPFDLTQGPLIRASLLRLGDEDVICRMTLHHIISDEWSTGILWDEMAHLYERLMRGNSPEEALASLPKLPIQYADYAYWQREQMTSEVAERQLAFWREQLGGELTQLQLPIAQSRHASQRQEGALLSRKLSPELASQLRTLSRQHETTLFVTLLSAFYVLLYRYTGQTDLLVGTPIANRNRPEIQPLIGFFINTVVLRGDLRENPSFTALLNQLRERTLNAIANQDLPFERLVEAIEPARDPGRNPLFQVMFTHQTDQTEQISLPDLTLEPIRIDSQVAKFDLTLFMNESGDDLSAAIEYNTQLFEPAAIERMLGHLDVLLQGIAANPEQPVDSLPILTAEEAEQILGEWSGIQNQIPLCEIIADLLAPSTPEKEPRLSRGANRNLSDDTKKLDNNEILIHEIIEAQANRYSNKAALIYDGQSIDYQTLIEQADALAEELQQQGVGPNCFVALHLDRSVEMIVAILGTLKAGGAYIPLDPAYPPERLAHMLQETAAPILLTRQHLLGTLPEYDGSILFFNAETEEWQSSVDSEQLSVSGEQLFVNSEQESVGSEHSQLAYAIFTSGSTGQPKGSVVTHANLVHSTVARFREYQEPVESFLLLSSFAFDSSIVGIFWTLCSGGTLVLPKQGEEKEVQRLAQLVEQNQVSHLLCLPSLYRALIDYADPAQLEPLRCAIVAGEACPPDLIARHFDVLPDAALYNEYGPTEGTVWSSFYQMQPDDASLPTVPIGRPIVNMQSYILDVNHQPLPVGVPGQLVISGLGITPGYLHRPELTAEKFVESIPAIGPQPPATSCYLTGDLVRWREDGQIEFLGRIDQQVKLRGFRVELGEIEGALLGHPEVDDAVALVVDDQLVAYLIVPDAVTFSEQSLRTQLAEQLPDYMIPTHFALLDTFPQTQNGKVDRKQLAQLELSPVQLKAEFVPPADELEIQLAAIWESVLKVRPIGRESNYFHLGGHSLQAIHLFQRIRERFARDMPLASLFQAPTLAEQADLLRNEGWTPDWSALVPIQPQGTQRPIFCAHAVGGNVLSLRLLTEHLGMDQPFYALQSQGLDGKETIPERVEEMAVYYIAEMKTVQPHGPYQLAGQSSGGLVAFEMAHQLVAQGEEVSILALIDTYLPAHALSANGPADVAVHDVNGGQGTESREWRAENERGIDTSRPSISLARRVQFHLNKIGQQGVDHIIQSARARAAKMQIRTRQRLENRAVQHLYQHYEKKGQPLPVRWRPIYVRTAIEKALRQYHPPIYSGDITLFRATESLDAYMEPVYGSHNSWERFTTGKIDVVDVEGGHNLEQEPAVGLLAEKLMNALA